jgi:hypothetical protein
VAIALSVSASAQIQSLNAAMPGSLSAAHRHDEAVGAAREHPEGQYQKSQIHPALISVSDLVF